MSPFQAQLSSAIRAARLAGDYLQNSFASEKLVDARTAHDIKLRMDKECQGIIRDALAKDWPDYSLLGEEGGSGGKIEWIVEPLDGSVNYFYGIPLFCVSIALRRSTGLRVRTNDGRTLHSAPRRTRFSQRKAHPGFLS